MNKESTGFFIFKIFLFSSLLIVLGLFYWSSTIVEDRLQSLKLEVLKIEQDLSSLHLESKENKLLIPYSLNNSIVNTQNILQPHSFYTTILPKLLGKNFVPLGIQHVATIGKPDTLHPFSNWSQVAYWHDLCNVSVGKLKFGLYETLTEDMGLTMEEIKNKETGFSQFVIHLRNDVFWQPLKQDFFSSEMILAPQFLKKTQVTAQDFKFFYDVIMNPYLQEPGIVALRAYYNDLEEFKVIDDFTFIVRWKANSKGDIKYIAKQMTGALKPLARWVYQYFPNGKKIIEDDAEEDTYKTNSLFAQNFSEHFAKNIIVSCGPWIFDGMSDKQINFIRNKDFYNPKAALTEKIENEFKTSPDNLWQSFKNGKLDSYTLQPNQLTELKSFMESEIYKKQIAEGCSINRLDYVGRSYSYIGWNEARPFFKSAKTRRALTMAIDRRRIIQDNLNGLGIEITGTFYRYSDAYDPSIKPLPYSPNEAKRLLEEEGWIDREGDGVIKKLIDKTLVPFRFVLTYYVKNSTSKSICEYVSTTLKEIGIDCQLNGVDIADISSIFDDKNFDAISLGWALGTPPENPRQLWYSSSSKEKGSSNAIGFSNEQIDNIIDALDYEYDKDKRIALYKAFDAIIHEEQPYTFLYTPKTAFLYRNYLKNVFIPIDRPDLIPGANIAEPDPSIFWIEH